ncbi:MAG: tetratricopeptide repeat protein [Rhodanobacter sp.]
MHRFGIFAALAASLCLAGCASHAPVKPTGTITLNLDEAGKPAPDADLQKVIGAVKMIQAGKIQLAIDGPLTEVVNAYEAMYAGKPVKVFCAHGIADALVYATMGDKAVNGKADVPVQVIGPAWAQAHWARAYAYTEMARYADARIELEKALALSPMDSQYKSELAFTYQHGGDWDKMLALYREAEGDAEISGGTPEQTTQLKCVALRGQGYALVELHRLDEAARAYQACLKLVPGEPKSLGELGYIQGLRAKSH